MECGLTLQMSHVQWSVHLHKRECVEHTSQPCKQRPNRPTCCLGGKADARAGTKKQCIWVHTGATWRTRWSDVCGGGDACCRYHYCSNFLLLWLRGQTVQYTVPTCSVGVRASGGSDVVGAGRLLQQLTSCVASSTSRPRCRRRPAVLHPLTPLARPRRVPATARRRRHFRWRHFRPAAARLARPRPRLAARQCQRRLLADLWPRLVLDLQPINQSIKFLIDVAARRLVTVTQNTKSFTL